MRLATEEQKVNYEAHEFSQKHVSTLEIRVSKLHVTCFPRFRVCVSSYDNLILGLHHKGVAGTEDQHQTHDSVKLPIWDFILFRHIIFIEIII